MQVFTHQLLHTNFSQLTRILHDITGTEKELVQILTEDLAAGLVDPSKAQQLLQQEAGGNGAPKQRPAVLFLLLLLRQFAPRDYVYIDWHDISSGTHKH
jgi:hypothetical protein